MAPSTKTTGKPKPASTPERVASLRDIAERDPLAAQDAAWEWFKRLGAVARSDRERGDAELADLFACGQPSRSIDGPTDGILVAPLIHPLVDPVVRAITGMWMPWQGKRFDAETQLGDNRLVGGVRWVGRLLWPRYSTRPGETGRLAFDFEMRVERGEIEPAVDVLVIDYAPVESNPSFIIRSIRDELVEIVEGAHLGRILWRHGDGSYSNIGYFALRTPLD
jgi:hypothetical protein